MPIKLQSAITAKTTQTMPAAIFIFTILACVPSRCEYTLLITDYLWSIMARLDILLFAARKRHGYGSRTQRPL